MIHRLKPPAVTATAAPRARAVTVRRALAALVAAVVSLPAGTAVATAHGPAPVGAQVTASRAETSLSLSVSHDVARKHEAVWATGTASAAGAALRDQKVTVQVRPASGGSWTSVGSARTSTTGRYSVALRVPGTVQVRAKVAATGSTEAARSQVREVATVTSDRTLGARRAALDSRAGEWTSGTKKLTKKQRTATRLKGLKAVRYRAVEKGLLVETRTTKETRTWRVAGKILTAYRAAGGPKGRYGVPVGDARCGLMSGGCVQRFSRGVLYSSSAKKKATGTGVRGARGEVAAAAASQLGYARRTTNSQVQHTKFNTWMGSTRPWCSIFMSWSFAASGHRSTVPQATSYTKFRAEVRRTMPTGRTPQVGALAFIDTRPPADDNHVALVVARKGKNVTIIEGNMGAGWGKRGVVTRTIRASSVIFYAYPSY